MLTPFIAAALTLLIALWGSSSLAQTSSPSASSQAPAVFAKFEKPFSTKKAKTGDEITARTVHDLRLKDLDIPKGSRLIGAVTAVQSEKEGNGDSSLSIKFDHVELKSGASLPIQGLIVSIGELSSATGLGPYSAFGRGGVGSTPGLDPNVGMDKNPTDEIPPGSSMPGVALGNRLSADGATELRGLKTDIKFDSDTEIKVALYRGH